MRKQRERAATKACVYEASMQSEGEKARGAPRRRSRIEGDELAHRPECICKDPKDGELRSGRPKPDESLVEGRRDSDVQIDRPT